LSTRICIFLLNILGWKTNLSFPNYLPRYIVLVAPHTSGWDVIIGALYRTALKMGDCKFLGKAELFKPPFGFVFRRMGGIPVERSNNHNLVEQVINLFNSEKLFKLALSPEGTRKKANRLKTGFYYMAKGANAPLVMAGLDFKNKRLIVSEPFFTTDNEQNDFKKIIEFFAPIEGKIPENGMMHLLANNDTND